MPERLVFRPQVPIRNTKADPVSQVQPPRLLPLGELPSMALSASMMELAALSHRPQTEIEPALKAAGFSLRHFGSQTVPMDNLRQADDGRLERAFAKRNTIDTQYFIAENEDSIVVAFRGSEEDVDYMNDLSFFASDSADGMGGLNPGFRRGIDAVWPQLRDQLREVVSSTHPPKKIVFTGHSLGAALSQLAALRWTEQEQGKSGAPGIYSVFNFAPPSVGGEQFANRYSAALGSKTYAYVNQGDAVPRALNAFGYQQPITHLFYLKTDGSVVTNPQSTAKDFWADTLTLKNKIPKSFEYHRPGYYVSRLRQLRAAEQAGPASAPTLAGPPRGWKAKR